jgi:4-hydroxy-2-oxoheptanedioate aldolase
MNPPTTPPVQLGLCIMYPSPGALERIGADFDWVWLDGQHGQIAGYDTMLAMVRACQSIGKPAWVRVPSHEAAWIGLALDMGAEAVIVPQVETVENARAVAHAAKFPPVGNRSFGGRRAIDRQGRAYLHSANSSTKLICQIESPEALQAAESIAAVEGVDGLFLGSDDFLLRSGVDIVAGGDDALLAQATAKLAGICAPRGLSLVCVGAGAAAFRLAMENGATHIVAGGDVGFLAAGAKEAVLQAREILNSLAPTASPVEKSRLY